MRRLGVLVLLAVALALPAVAEEDPREVEECLEAVRSYVKAVYAARYVDAFRQVRGVPDPEEAGDRFLRLVHESRASIGYRRLSACENNLFALAGALESRSGGPPARLEEVVGPGSPFPQGMPDCPAGGTYGYTRSGSNYRLWCGEDAHLSIGIGGNYPLYTRQGGLSLGGQELSLQQPLHLEVEDWDVEFVGFADDYNVFAIAHTERSRLRATDPMRERRSVFLLSEDDGRWQIDLALSNRDMVFVFDEREWTESATAPRQVLFYYQLAESVGFELPDVDSRARLEVRICEANLRNLSLALENWSVDHHGAYPRKGWSDVVPRYLKALPHCPAGGKYRYRHEAPGGYRVECAGTAHAEAGLPADYPALTPVLGVTEGP